VKFKDTYKRKEYFQCFSMMIQRNILRLTDGFLHYSDRLLFWQLSKNSFRTKYHLIMIHKIIMRSKRRKWRDTWTSLKTRASNIMATHATIKHVWPIVSNLPKKLFNRKGVKQLLLICLSVGVSDSLRGRFWGLCWVDIISIGQLLKFGCEEPM